MLLFIYFVISIFQMSFVAHLNELRPQGGQILLILFKFFPSFPEKGTCKALVISRLLCLQLKTTIFVQFKQVYNEISLCLVLNCVFILCS